MKRFLIAALIASSLGSASLTVGAATAAGRYQLGAEAYSFRNTIQNDTLWVISRSLATSASGVTQNQVMVALLRRNPDAFRGGNVFYMRVDVPLTVPSLAEVQSEPADKADEVVALHQKQWKLRKASAPPLYSVVAAPPGAEAPSAPAPEAGAGATPAAPAPVVVPPVGNAGERPQVADQPAAVPELGRQSPASSAPVLPSLPGGVSPVWLLAFFLVGVGGLWAVRRWEPARAETAVEEGERPTGDPSRPKREYVPPADLTKVLPDVGDSTGQMVRREGGLEFEHSVETAAEADVKILIAQAYVELKNFVEARGMLREVETEGTSEQQEFARRLLAEIPA